MKLLVVVVNYRCAEFTVGALRTLLPELAEVPDSAVAVVDNASLDGSAERLRSVIDAEGWSERVTLIVSERNGGYAFGNNLAIRPALASDDPPEYVWLLNPDTLVRPGAARILLEFMEARPEIGIAGSRLEEEDGTQHASRYRFHSVWSELESGFRLGLVTRLLEHKRIMPPLVTEDHEIDWVAGASMIIRRAVFEEIGLLDEAYFLYFEEVDFCLRARRAGWPCWYVPDSRVAHLVGKSSGVTQKTEPARRRPPYWFESRRRYFVKNHGRLYAFLASAAWAVGFGLWRLRRPLQGKPDRDPPHLWWDFVRFNFLFGSRGPGAAD